MQYDQFDHEPIRYHTKPYYDNNYPYGNHHTNLDENNTNRDIHKHQQVQPHQQTHMMNQQSHMQYRSPASNFNSSFSERQFPPSTPNNRDVMDLENLPVADLPLYELPPQYIPRSERRFHPDYCNDLRKFQNRTICLQRNKPSDQLGFNVRGGSEHKCGIFISKVMPRTDAHKAGLQEGDQILFANGESFLHIGQHEAVKSLKRHVDVELIVKYFPYAYDKSFDKCKTNPSYP